MLQPLQEPLVDEQGAESQQRARNGNNEKVMRQLFRLDRRGTIVAFNRLACSSLNRPLSVQPAMALCNNSRSCLSASMVVHDKEKYVKMMPCQERKLYFLH